MTERGKDDSGRQWEQNTDKKREIKRRGEKKESERGGEGAL